MKMYELISWFQMEYPELVLRMKNANHHLTDFDEYRMRLDNLKEGDPVFIAPDNRGFPENLNPFHLESDIFTHTMMVCKQAENLPYEVQIAALLHDIGKPATRKVNPKNGRVNFFNHDSVSAFMSLEILKRPELNLTDEQRIMIFRMIALHTQVYKLTPEQLADIGDIELVNNLILLGNADHKGRFHSHEGAEIVTLEKVLEAQKDLDSSRIFFPPKKEVIVLVGLPASGKSTWTDQYQDNFYVSRDNCLMRLASQKFQEKEFTYKEAWESISQKSVDKLLQKNFEEVKLYSKSFNRDIIIDMTHMSKKSRKRSLSHFNKNEYRRKCVVFLTDLPTLFERNNNRTGKTIDRRVIERMMSSFYLPTLEEFDEIEYVLT